MPAGSVWAIGVAGSTSSASDATLFHDRHCLADPHPSVRDRAGALGRVPPLLQQQLDRVWEGLPSQPEHTLQRLHARKPDLGAEREHVRGEARGEQRLGPAVRHLRLGFGEPVRQRSQHLHVGRHEHIWQRHGRSFPVAQSLWLDNV